jgi:integrase
MPKLVEGYADKMRVAAGKRDALAFDDELAGFGIRKFASGAAFYFIKFSVAGRTKRISLGAVLRGNLKAMRMLASDVKARARLGQDVLAEKRTAAEGKQAAKTAATLGVLVPVYLKEREDDLSDKTHHEATRYLTKACAPLHHLVVGTVTRGDQVGVVDLGKRWTPINGHKLEIVSRAHVVGAMDELAKTSGKVTADRAKTSLSTFFGWCIDRSFCDLNPTLHIKARAANGSRKRVLSERELAEVWRATLATPDDEYGQIIRLLVLTGQRRSEIADLHWPEVNLAYRYLEKDRDGERRECVMPVIELPPHRTKNRLAHLVPLNAEALAIIKGIPASKTRNFVFGRGSGGYGGWSKSKAQLDAKIAGARAKGLGDMEPWTLHDIRRTVATNLREQRFADTHLVELILNHVSGTRGGVAGTYDRSERLDDRRKALELWGTYVAQLVRKPLPEPQRVQARKSGRGAPKAARVTAA